MNLLRRRASLWLVMALVSSIALSGQAQSAEVLFVGNENAFEPTSGDDGFVFDHLVELGHDVTYLAASEATTDDGEAVDLIVLSSTFGSGNVRGKYPDVETPILQWEEALIREQTGNFNMSFASGNGGDAQFDAIIIEEANHPIVKLAGLGAGEILVYDTFKNLVYASDLSPDTVGIATHADSGFEDRWVLSAIEAGGELTDGELAAGPRVNFFIENTGFSNLTDEGKALFNASISWLLGDDGGGGEPELEAGDADQDLDFDQLDLVKVQIAAKYLTGQAATWGDGDWNGAPGGKQGEPPVGDGLFDQLDIIASLNAGKYLTGPYAALSGEMGDASDEQTSLVYDTSTGELAVNAPANTNLTSINIDSAGSLFSGDKPAVLDGAFDNFESDNIFKATFGGSFGDISFGNVMPAGMSEAEVNADLSAVGSLEGGGELGPVDLIYIPEPSALLLLGLGWIGVLSSRRRRK